jgi:hypothetical protein
MKFNKKKLLGVFVVLFIVMSLFVVSAWRKSGSGIEQRDPDPLPSSVEQDNINNRLQIMNEASTTLWFYGLSDTGTIIFRSTVKGKVTSSGKRLEPATGTGGCPSENSQGYCSNEMLQADGTFGESDSYVFWFDFEDNYYQWNGKYILTTKPLSIPTVVIEFQ